MFFFFLGSVSIYDEVFFFAPRKCVQTLEREEEIRLEYHIHVISYGKVVYVDDVAV